MEIVSDTSWIKPGADVVVYWDTLRETKRPQRAKVATVAVKSFTVVNIDNRFSRATMATKPSNSWNAGKYVALHPDSDKARALLEVDRRNRLIDTACTALDEWRKNPSREQRLVAIEALRKVED